jgi:hypothetical protein
MAAKNVYSDPLDKVYHFWYIGLTPSPSPRGGEGCLPAGRQGVRGPG